MKHIFTHVEDKLLALLLASLLVLFVSGNKFRVGFLPTSLPLEVKNIPASMTITSEIPSVFLKVRVPSELWNSIGEKDFSVSIDLEGAKVGTNSVPIFVAVHNPQVVLLEKRPEMVEIILENAASNTFPVSIKTKGNPKEGYEIGTITQSSKKAEVSGSASVLERVATLSATISIEGVGAPQKQISKITAFDQQGRQIHDVTISPATVEVSIEIPSKIEIREIPIVVNMPDAVQKKYGIQGFTIAPVTAKISGPLPILALLSQIETTALDENLLQNHPSKITTSLRGPDDGLSLISPKEVTISISYDETTTKKDITVPILIIAAPEGITPILVPNTTVLTISGPPPIVQSIKADDISVTLDLSALEGTTTVVQLSSKNIRLPNAVHLESIKTTSIVVTFGDLHE